MNKKIYLIRHCRATGQEASAPLTKEGFEQAEILAEELSPSKIGRIISSPYLRATQSIAPLAKVLSLPVETDSRLIERILSGDSLPDWEHHLERSFDDLDAALPGGESSRTAIDRGLQVINGIYEREEHCTAVVTHGNLMSLILRYFDNTFGFKEWKTLSNPDIYRIQGDRTSFHIGRQ